MTASKGPTVGVIVVTFNSEQFIKRCLASIAKQTYGSIRVYVVENNSSDATLARVQEHDNCLVLAQETNTGYAGGNNIGIKQALANGCDAVFLLNPDAYIEQDTIETLVQAYEKEERVGALQPLIVLHPETDTVNSSGNLIHYLGFGYTRDYKRKIHDVLPVAQNNREVPYASGAAVFYSKEALDDAGLFDEAFFLYHEDLDLSWRMRLLGWDVRLVSEARAFHEYSFSKSITKYYYMERNRMLFLVKNFSVHYLFLIFPMFLVTEVGLLLFSLRNDFFMERLSAWGYFFKRKNRKALMASRRDIQQRRMVSDKALVPFLTDRIAFQDVDSTLLTRVGNPLFKVYFSLIRPFI